MTVASAKEQPVHLVLSGPAGGVIGAAALGKILGHENLITIDMGGTSLDASLIAGGQAKVETEQQFQTLPVSIPTIDIHTIGAGGGASRGSTTAVISRSGRRARVRFPGRPATAREATRRRSRTRRWRSATSIPRTSSAARSRSIPG